MMFFFFFLTCIYPFARGEELFEWGGVFGGGSSCSKWMDRALGMGCRECLNCSWGVDCMVNEGRVVCRYE